MAKNKIKREQEVIDALNLISIFLCENQSVAKGKKLNEYKEVNMVFVIASGLISKLIGWKK